MRTRRKRARLALLATVAVVAAGAGAVAQDGGFLRELELDSIDQRFELRPDRARPDAVAVVAIDGPTFSRLEERWPLRRRHHAKLIDRLKAAGARVIAYDVQFTEPSPNAYDDFKLIDAVAAARNVVLGTSEVDPGGKTNVLGGDENVRAAHGRVASAQYDLDPNGVIRRIPFASDGLESMAVVSARAAYGRVPSRDLFEPRGAWIDFAGGPGSVRTYEFADVLDKKFPTGAFRGKVVVVGATAPSLQDVHPTSTSGAGQMSGPEIQAHAIDTLRRGAPLTGAPGGLNVALVILMALVAPAAGLRLGGLGSLAAAVVAMAAFAVAAQLVFNSGTIVAFVIPMAAAVLATTGTLVVHYLTEVRERRRTRAAFARFVPAAVVDRVLEQSEDGLRLGGEEVLGTVLFSDIRGFTTFSESHPAPEVLEILNHYLGEMTDAIMSHGGTLVAYLGDGIIAVFGAPLEQDDHADRALAAAQEMLGPRLAAFNEWARERGSGQEFQMGIGINSGFFMAGNVGSTERLEYTVIGDTINTAARMEGLTKGSGHSLFIAESTRFMLLGEAPDLEYVGEFDIRGREAKMKVWAPAGERKEPVIARDGARSGIHELISPNPVDAEARDRPGA